MIHAVRRAAFGLLLLTTAAPAVVRAAPPQPPPKIQKEKGPGGKELVQLDFDDVELPVVIDTIARLTGKNFIYDDRVRGRVTIVSPTKIPVDQAYAVFQSVLQVKGFTTVPGAGDTIKIIPVREAKESSVDTRKGPRPTPDTDNYVTRLIPLHYIDADAITNTLKPLVSNDASIVSYAPTNTVILTDSASNIRRILTILEALDVETYKPELSVIRLKHADAATLANQLSNLFQAQTGGTSPSIQRLPVAIRARLQAAQNAGEGGGAAPVRIITDERTNSLIVVASHGQLDEIRDLVHKLDVPVEGGGRIQVYYLKNADAEDIAKTLQSLIQGQPSGASAAPSPGGAAHGGSAEALRAAVTELAGGATVTADKATNSLVIQASPEGYQALLKVIQKLDIPRSQVLVEALIMEVNVTNGRDLGFNGLYRIAHGTTNLTTASSTDLGSNGTADLIANGAAAAATGGASAAIPGLIANAIRDNTTRDSQGNIISGDLIQGIIRATATDNHTNILSAPHILTSDNEEAQILVGNNIPIITSRVQSAQGITTAQQSNLATSVNVERQDIGVTLRVTPQITEGDNLRLKIFQEVTNVDQTLSGITGPADQVGVSLTNRKIENNVVVADGQTVVIGGLISDNYQTTITKVPWLGDVPVFGWLFKTKTRSLQKQNLIVFLTPHIIRKPADLVRESIRKREEFRLHSEGIAAGEAPGGVTGEDVSVLGEPGTGEDPTRAALAALAKRYPLERMREIEKQDAAEHKQAEQEAAKPAPEQHYEVLAAVFRDQDTAQSTLRELLDAGYPGVLVSGKSGGSVLFELRLGPYASLVKAQKTADTVREAYGLAPQVIVKSPKAGSP